MGYTRHKRDANHTKIKKDLLQLSYDVQELHMVGSDFPDLLVAGYAAWLGCSINVLVEVKVEKGKLSRGQERFFATWKGHKLVARSTEDIIHFFQSTTQPS